MLSERIVKTQDIAVENATTNGSDAGPGSACRKDRPFAGNRRMARAAIDGRADNPSCACRCRNGQSRNRRTKNSSTASRLGQNRLIAQAVGCRSMMRTAAMPHNR